jgi:hypothetical protein
MQVRGVGSSPVRLRADTRGVINLMIAFVLCTASSSIPSVILFATIPERIVISVDFYAR